MYSGAIVIARHDSQQRRCICVLVCPRAGYCETVGLQSADVDQVALRFDPMPPEYLQRSNVENS